MMHKVPIIPKHCIFVPISPFLDDEIRIFLVLHITVQHKRENMRTPVTDEDLPAFTVVKM